MKFFDRVKVYVGTTGPADITFGTEWAAFLSPAQASAQAGDTTPYMLMDGLDFEEGVMTIGAGAASGSRAVTKSKIGGVVGTAKLNLSGNATLIFTIRGSDVGTPGVDGASAFTVVRLVDTAGADPATAYESGNTIDGKVLVTNDLILRAKTGGDAANGIYVVPVSGAASRAAAFATYNDHAGRYFSVMEGVVAEDKLYRCTSNKGGTLGTTAIVMTEFSSGATGALLAVNNLSDLVNAAIARLNLGVRDVLAANRSYYVAPAPLGSDSNDGLGVGTPFLTIQKAIDVISALDINIYSVTINVADGTYTGANTVKNAWLGSGTVSITGNVTTPANVIINPASGSAIRVQNGGTLTVSGMEVRGGVGLSAGRNSSLTVGTSMRFGGSSAYQVYADGGYINMTSSYTISGGGLAHLQVEAGGSIDCSSRTVTITGIPTFSLAFVSTNGPGTRATVASNTYTGSANGPRFTAQQGGFISVGGGAVNPNTYLPGNSNGSGSNFGVTPWGLVL